MAIFSYFLEVGNWLVLKYEFEVVKLMLLVIRATSRYNSDIYSSLDYFEASSCAHVSPANWFVFMFILFPKQLKISVKLCGLKNKTNNLQFFLNYQMVIVKFFWKSLHFQWVVYNNGWFLIPLISLSFASSFTRLTISVSNVFENCAA